MDAFHEYMNEYREQLKKGAIQKAYKGLMEYLMGLRTYFRNAYPDYFVSSSLYYGTMDMTYFALFPEAFKRRNLKIAIVFLHEAFRFEVWLAGVNRQVQEKTWKLFKESDWKPYPIVPNPKGIDAIVEHVLVDQPDFRDLEALTKQIKRGTSVFIQEIEGFLSTH